MMGIGTWHNTRLKDQLMIVGGNGFSPDLQGHNKGDYPFCKCSDISSSDKLSTAANYVSFKDIIEQGYNLVPAYSILVAKIGESMKKNRRSLNLVPCCIDNNMQAFVPKGSLDPLFGYYLLSLIDFADYDNGGPVPSINNQRLVTKVVSIPSIREQKEITSLLGEKCTRIDGVVSTLETQISTLERYHASVIHEAVTRGLDLTAPTKPSGVDWIGEIPKSWESNRMRYLASMESGATPSKDNLSFWEGTTPWVSSMEVKQSVLQDTSLHISKEAIESCSTRILPKGTLVMVVRSGILQHTIPVALLGKAMAINQDVKAFTFNDSMVAKYFYYFVKGNNDNLLKTLLKDKSTVDNINQEYLKSLLIPVPPIEEQIRIVNYLDARTAAIDAVLDTKRKQLDVLKRRRKSLIYEYVTGKRRVNQEA